MTTLKLTPYALLVRPIPYRSSDATPPLGWLDRLAALAERQPRHRRLGCWTAL